MQLQSQSQIITNFDDNKNNSLWDKANYPCPDFDFDSFAYECGSQMLLKCDYCRPDLNQLDELNRIDRINMDGGKIEHINIIFSEKTRLALTQQLRIIQLKMKTPPNIIKWGASGDIGVNSLYAISSSIKYSRKTFILTTNQDFIQRFIHR